MNQNIKNKTFMGYRRPNGTVGVRNHVLVLPTVICSAQTALRIVNRIPGAVSFYHEHGCGHLAPDYLRTKRTLIGHGTNPNVASVLVVGLGCEQVTAEEIAEGIAASGKRVEVLVIQESHGIRNTIKMGRKIVREMVAEAAKIEREPVPVSGLILGTECGGSDAMSGLAGNPAVGASVDRIIAHGGKGILSETPELIGAEHILAERAASDSIRKHLLKIVEQVELTAKRVGEDIRGTQPCHGNMEGGLTTIEEKSLGCIRKGGTYPVQAVVDYSEDVTEQGLTVMDTTGDDVRSIAGMVAGGSQVVVFTTGRGTPTGSPIAPVVKISTNSRTFKEMRDCIDINAGTVVDGIETPDEVGERIFQYVLEVASGKKTKAELLGQGDFAIDRLLPSL
jgi:altronate dehydratase large subunit